MQLDWFQKKKKKKKNTIPRGGKENLWSSILSVQLHKLKLEIFQEDQNIIEFSLWPFPFSAIGKAIIKVEKLGKLQQRGTFGEAEQRKAQNLIKEILKKQNTKTVLLQEFDVFSEQNNKNSNSGNQSNNKLYRKSDSWIASLNPHTKGPVEGNSALL